MDEIEQSLFTIWYETNCVESTYLEQFFKYVCVGWIIKDRIAIAKRKMNIK